MLERGSSSKCVIEPSLLTDSAAGFLRSIGAPTAPPGPRIPLLALEDEMVEILCGEMVFQKKRQFFKEEKTL